MSLIAAMIAAGFGLTLVVFYPGVITYDARYVYIAIAEGRAGDWQSPLMTALWSLIDPIAPGAASMFLLIATLYWLGFAVLALRVARHAFWLALAVPLIALAPPAFVFVGIIWRDVLFGAVWLLAAALGFAAAEQGGKGRLVVQALACGLLAFGVLIRPNALLAAPILAAYIAWPWQFRLRQAAVLYVPAVVAFYALIHIVYYGVLDAKREHPLHSILVFDLGGITHFTKENQFPVSWTPSQTALLINGCYQPAEWNIYWTSEPCRFVMARLEGEKIFGAPTLVDAWRRAVLAHPVAYLRHRAAFMATLLAGRNLTMWTLDIDRPERTVFADRPAFMALKAIHDALAPTPLFRAGAWLLLCALVGAFAWRRRKTSSGAFVVGVCGSAVIYMATFLAVGVAADFRYAFWAVLAGLAGVITLAFPPRVRPAIRAASPV